MDRRSFIGSVGAVVAASVPAYAQVAPPGPVDCLAGPKPSIPGMLTYRPIQPFLDAWAQSARQCVTAPDNAVVFVGDSFLNYLCTDTVAAPSVNTGVSGQSMRGVMNQLAAPAVAGCSIASLLHRAGALVLMNGACGLNHIIEELAAWPTHPEYMAADADLMLREIAAWVTGRGVITTISPCIDGPTMAPLTNARIAAVNALVHAHFDGKSGWIVVDDTAQLALPNGQLNPAYTTMPDGSIDGCHLGAAGWAIRGPLIKAALQTVMP